MEAVAGITIKDTDLAAVTFKVAEPDMPSKVAVMTDAVPARIPVAHPDVGLTEALPELPEIQVEEFVTSMDVPSLYVAIAVNCWLPVTGTEAVAGVTCMDANVRAGNQ
ncbi:hypothetical protein ASZ90_006064 [hydrocarbon metagenome]|uniref:Uncharacterized protein n=1 Tax=hydrocarbon metagenome TaxID=938273 RepID=A0A0W8FTG4_9ZZZZ